MKIQFLAIHPFETYSGNFIHTSKNTDFTFEWPFIHNSIYGKTPTVFSWSEVQCMNSCGTYKIACKKCAIEITGAELSIDIHKSVKKNPPFPDSNTTSGCKVEWNQYFEFRKNQTQNKQYFRCRRFTRNPYYHFHSNLYRKWYNNCEMSFFWN